MLNTLRKKLMFAFGLMALTVLMVSLLNLWYNNQLQAIQEHRIQLDKVHINILRTLTYGRDFFNYETINNDFFKTGESEFIERHRKGIDECIESMEYLIFLSDHRSDKVIKDELINLNNEVALYEEAFEGLAANLRKRGFYEYGLIGDLRKSAHELENANITSNDTYLSLRRAEKDYMLRLDTQYHSEVERILTKIEAELAASKIDANSKAGLNKIINNYRKDFNEIIRFDRYIGYKKEMGLTLKLKNQIEGIEQKIEMISARSKALQATLIQGIQITFVVVLILQIILAIILSWYLAQRFSSPIEKLSMAIDRVVESDFSNLEPVPVSKTDDELARLKHNFNSFLNKLGESLEEISKSKAETEEINSVLRALNQEFKASRKQLKEVNALKDKMFQIVAHDLRVPFTNMSAFLEAISLQADSFSPEELQIFGQRMQQTITELRNLSTTLIQWALAQSEGVKYNPRKVDVRNIFEHNIHVQEYNASSRLVELHTEYKGETTITVDPDILNFVLRNLLTHALRHSKVNGNIWLIFENAKSQYKYIVKDDGATLSAESMASLFDIQQQVDTTNRDQSASLGIGLALCKEFIQVAEGEIFAEPNPEGGTIFTISFINLEGI